MGRHNQKPESAAPSDTKADSAPPPAPHLGAADFLTWPLFGLAAAVALVLGIVIGLLIA